MLFTLSTDAAVQEHGFNLQLSSIPHFLYDEKHGTPMFTQTQLEEYNKYIVTILSMQNGTEKHNENIEKKPIENHKEKILDPLNDPTDPFKFKTEGPIDKKEEDIERKSAIRRCSLCGKYKKEQTEIDLKKMSDLPDICNKRIDVVWSWVNGTDPNWLESLKKYVTDFDPYRYRNTDTLVYSMRGVYKYLPYVKNYFIVTANQVPDFLDAPYNLTSFILVKNNITLEIVPHSQIIEKKFLPVFNSEAIETSLHKIKNLGECFIYLNDDVFFNKPTPPDYFVKNGKLQVHVERSAPEVVLEKKSLVHSCISHSNRLVNKFFKKPENTRHRFMSHTAHFFKKSISYEVEKAFWDEFENTRSKRTRAWQTTNWSYMVGVYEVIKGYGVDVREYNLAKFWMFEDKHQKNVVAKIQNDEINPYVFCVNDDMTNKTFEKEMRYIHRWLVTKFPDKTVFEK
ncbi:capsular polysaccharide phosphotransferase, putative [Entamoeba invadens IP1]|uniref:Capsular polysaccharide phosphotransferase, putative n=1 Tax=Entamoeba invadens IP1 TaxID=370355 RepID=A0A0A1TV24_ENTIV|nr:capsular polysaccharide phosphotransferase, putative [Entamoeba invadens IP1]ELP84136.1 capsular polysaccharide phosphotransferase, putative [Entamoeba invadens IP1]|eukprot:XP_004183482.1 capsular polysaccharide phosphotransferase, putative [Entamoeba invadens IP1]